MILGQLDIQAEREGIMEQIFHDIRIAQEGDIHTAHVV